MIAPRPLFRLALVASLTFVAGCGGTPPEVDTAETTQTDPAAKKAPEPAPTPAPTPEAAPAKEAPKG